MFSPLHFGAADHFSFQHKSSFTNSLPSWAPEENSRSGAVSSSQREMFVLLLLPVAGSRKHQIKMSDAAPCKAQNTSLTSWRRSNSPKIKGLVTISELSIIQWKKIVFVHRKKKKRKKRGFCASPPLLLNAHSLFCVPHTSGPHYSFHT